MQDIPEQFQLLTNDESDETPKWVADAGSDSWRPQGLTAGLADTGARSCESYHRFMPQLRDLVPQGLPLPELLPPLRPADRASKPDIKPLTVLRHDDKVIVPTFSMGDPDVGGGRGPTLNAYDANSPEAKLYRENLESIVKLTVDRVAEDGKTKTSSGSGFFVTENGQIATANHVVEGADRIVVTAANGRKYDARVKVSHPGSESAVIELTNAAPNEKFRPIPLANSAVGLNSSDTLTVLGHPGGVDEVVMSRGKFISRDKYISTEFRNHPDINPHTMFIHANTRVQGGNSGSPLLDSQGRAVGLTNFKHGNNEGAFVGIDDVRSLVTDPKLGQLSDLRSYFVPSSIQLDSDAAWKGYATFLAGANLVNAHVQQNRKVPFLAAGSRTLGTGATFGIAVANLPFDGMKFKEAWQNGTTAEKANAGINLGGDVLMGAGSIVAMASRRYPVVGASVATVGAVARFGNSLFGDRRYH
jgi:S1-C subfamily serine protease